MAAAKKYGNFIARYAHLLLLCAIVVIFAVNYVIGIPFLIRVALLVIFICAWLWVEFLWFRQAKAET